MTLIINTIRALALMVVTAATWLLTAVVILAALFIRYATAIIAIIAVWWVFWGRH